MRKILLALFLVLARPAFAQEPLSTATVVPAASPLAAPTAESPTDQAVTLEEISVTAEREGIGRKEITGDDIEDIQNSGDVSSTLDHESGLETQGEGMGKTWSTLAIRGQSFRETVILVNGQRVPSGFNLGTIPTQSIEKVEVLEGPQALAYGSDALGGVVNILTRTLESNPGSLQVSGGDFNTYQFQASLPGFKVGGVQNNLSGSWFTTDGYLPPDPVSGLGFTDETHWDVSHSASWKMGDGQAVLSSIFFRHIGSAPDADNVVAAGTDQYDLDGRQDAWGIQSSLRDDHPLGGGWRLEPALTGSYSDVIRSNPIGADPTSGVPYRTQYLDDGGQVYASGPVGGFLEKLDFGLETREEALWSDFYGDRSRWTETAVIEGTFKMSEDLHLEWANRLDNYSDYAPADNPTGTLVLEAAKGFQAYLSVGKGTRIPTYDQLFLPPTAFAGLAQFAASPFVSAWAGDKGNPGLLPEQSIDGELGTDITAGDFLVQLAGFVNYYQDLINPFLDPSDNYWTYANIDHALFAGTEDGVRYRLGEVLEPHVSATYISATDQDGNPIQGRMHFKFTAGMDLKPEKTWSLDINARYVDRYPVTAQYLTDLGKPSPPTDYWTLEAEAKYSVSYHLNGFIKVENILNDAIASLQGIPLPGRYFEGGLQGTF